MSTLTLPSALGDYNTVDVDLELIRRLDRNGPRYTSYPTADRFVEAFNQDGYAAWMRRRNIGPLARPLSLYFHLPFCNTVCYYCACNKVITKDRGRSAKYVRYLVHEMKLQASLLGRDRRVEQLHWGGGTPTFLPHEQIIELMTATREHFQLVDNGEYSIEIDPRKVDTETVTLLSKLGFNRMSIGVQDFEPAVQVAVNRVQSEEETRSVMEAARSNGFKSISVDLIYGLPLQTVESFDHTLDKVIAMSPNRLSIYNYAHMPQLFKPQRRINVIDLPQAKVKLDIMKHAITKLADAGYIYVGMDHFSRPDDELAIAQRQGRLHRNFQGYSTHADCDLVAMGVSAIGKIGPTYSQNYRTLDEYYDCLDRDELPIMRGIELTGDDLLRRAIIQALMCQFEISIESLEIAHLVDFHRYFATELVQLREYEKAGLLSIKDGWLTVTPKGRLLIRTICMVFDRYLRHDEERQKYSKVI